MVALGKNVKSHSCPSFSYSDISRSYRGTESLSYSESTMAPRVIVIGSGLCGLVTASTYLKIDPSIDLTILEAESTLGGTWSSERIYPTLQCQQPCGAYEYPGHPLVNPENGSRNLGTYGNFIPGPLLTKYFEEYAKKEGIADKIVYNTKVVWIEKLGTVEHPEGWKMFIEGGRTDGSPDYTCDKLILATGLTSEEEWPGVKSREAFHGPIVHSKYIGKNLEALTSDKISTITIYGGGKSSLDALYMCMKAGKKVNWIIRPDELSGGTPYYAAGMILGMNTNAVISSRFTGKLHPFISETNDWWYRFLHSGKSAFGRWLLSWYWGLISKIMSIRYFGYDKSENGKKLIPQIKAEDGLIFWSNNAPAIITQPDIIDWIHKSESVTVYRASIESFTSPNTIRLVPPPSSSEEPITLTTDAVIFATGYKTLPSFLSESLQLHLGLPTPLESVPPEYAQKWDALSNAADEKITTLFPKLANPPRVNIEKSRSTPHRLYRYLVPTEYIRHGDRSFFVMGACSALNMAIMSQLSALWGIAWMTGKMNPLEKITIEDVEREVAEQSVWTRRRYLNNGERMPYYVYEFMPIFDTMMRDLGLNPYRKGGGWKEFFGEYAPMDYNGVVEEWMEKEGMLEPKDKAV